MTTSQEKKWGNITPTEIPEGVGIGIVKMLVFDFTPIYPCGCRNIEELFNLFFPENLNDKQNNHYDLPFSELLKLASYRSSDEEKK